MLQAGHVARAAALVRRGRRGCRRGCPKGRGLVRDLRGRRLLGLCVRPLARRSRGASDRLRPLTRWRRGGLGAERPAVLPVRVLVLVVLLLLLDRDEGVLHAYDGHAQRQGVLRLPALEAVGGGLEDGVVVVEVVVVVGGGEAGFGVVFAGPLQPTL